MKRISSEVFLKSMNIFEKPKMTNITDILFFFQQFMYVGKFPQWKGDKWCDDDNNNCGCQWDGGDCCGEDNKYDSNYCTECACKDPAAKAGR